jgi:hypothetical protein
MAVLMVAMVRHGRGNVCARTGREGIREGAVARAQDVLKCVCPKPAGIRGLHRSGRCGVVSRKKR